MNSNQEDHNPLVDEKSTVTSSAHILSNLAHKSHKKEDSKVPASVFIYQLLHYLSYSLGLLRKKYKSNKSKL
jgi:hypothetical protein